MKIILKKKNLNIYYKDLRSINDIRFQDKIIDKDTVITNCQLNKDYFVFNPNLDIKQEEFKKETLIDSPETWRKE